MKKIIALAALAALSATASAANLLTDGSFESITQAAGTWNVYKGVNLPGWTVTKANGSATSHGLEVRNNNAGTAEDGHNFIELDGYENDKISQSFTTVVGKDYEITFFYADRPDVTSTFLQGTKTVQGSGGFAYTLTGAPVTTYAGAFGAFWHEAVIDFTAASTSTTFSIWAVGKSDGYGTSFDDFSAAAVVPEPATLGLFAAGLAVLGLSSRRRRQQ
ncbi:MAG: PEP-CTERM sorting domain-containing protein [Pseudomonadota bacterium]|nr:PEP-CTERM sorting domain-containing protein [Pseudomonadota bacterium]